MPAPVRGRVRDTAELAAIPAGPVLSAALAGVDPARLCGFDLVELITARGRQVAYEQAQLLAGIHELAYTPPSVGAEVRRAAEPDEYVVEEVAFALAWTSNAAYTQVGLALHAIDRLPAVFAALATGRIDLAKARVLCDELDLVEEPTARGIAEAVLAGGEGRRCTTGQLRQRLRRLVAAVDPDAVRARHRKAVADRCVDHVEYANGTSTLAGFYLPTDRAAAAWEHIDAIARATKAAGPAAGGGPPRSIAQIRADVFADLLTGIDPGHTGHATPTPGRGVINLHVGLSTLAHLSEHPGEIPGFGPVIADIARQVTAQMADRAHWRFTATDPNGHTVAEGRLRYRPSYHQRAFIHARDRTCRAPGCRRPATRCDIDHIHDWARGGPTTLDNLCCLCRRHHRAKHIAGYDIQRTVHGYDWTTPRGHRYTVIGDHSPPPTPTEHAFATYIAGHHTPGRLRR